MALLVGQEAEGSVEETIASERAMSFKFTAGATGKVSSLSIKLGAASGTGTSGRLAVQADEGGTKPKEGVLCEGPIASVAAGEHTTTSLTAEPELTSGTVYWLTILSLGGSAKIKCGTTTSRQKTTVNRSLISIIVAADWSGSVTKGPASIWASSSESTKVEGKASGALLLTGTAKGTAANVVTGKASGPLLLTGTAKGTAANVVTGKASGALLLTGTAKGTVSEGSVVNGKAAGAILLAGSAKGTVVSLVKGKAAGVLLLTGTASGTARAVVSGKASGQLVLGGTATGSSRAVVLGLAHGTLVLTGAASASGGGTVVVSHPGMVSPSSRAGRLSPMSVAGLVKPRPGHVVAGLRPKPGLYPKVGLWPKGDTIVPD